MFKDEKIIGINKAYHRGTTVSRYALAFARRPLSTRFIHGQIACNSPLRTTDRLRSLVELRGHVEVVDCGLTAIYTVEADEGVDLEVGEMKVDVDGVQANQEVDKGFLLASRYMGEKRRCDRLSRWEMGTNWEVKSESFGVDITDVDTSLVGEKDRITLALGGDADVVLCVGWMREERLEDEVVQGAGHGLDLRGVRSTQTLIRVYHVG